MSLDKDCKCNDCGYEFVSMAEIKNIRCPSCKSNKSLSILETLIVDPPGPHNPQEMDYKSLGYKPDRWRWRNQ